jgi:biotin operon repressor
MKSGKTDNVLSGETISELYGISVQLVKKNGR